MAACNEPRTWLKNALLLMLAGRVFVFYGSLAVLGGSLLFSSMNPHHLAPDHWHY
jgi:hypothetical protein